MPSVADAFVVAGGIPLTLAVFIFSISPVLDYFEGKQLPLVGYAVLMLILVTVGGSILLAYLHNGEKIRPEICAPRQMCAYVAPGLIMLLLPQIVTYLERNYPEHVFQAATWIVVSLVAVIAGVYCVLARIALRNPLRLPIITLWVRIGFVVAATAAVLGASYLGLVRFGEKKHQTMKTNQKAVQRSR
ncbi:MAG: hypothetical protein C0404_00520 [Verrucomicrobia bacterium]|nr:hypothetical protein [Verrucomicrobiota bacterium]